MASFALTMVLRCVVIFQRFNQHCKHFLDFLSKTVENSNHLRVNMNLIGKDDVFCHATELQRGYSADDLRDGDIMYYEVR